MWKGQFGNIKIFDYILITTFFSMITVSGNQKSDFQYAIVVVVSTIRLD